MLFTGPHDYFNRDYVREWTESANLKRPFRVLFLEAFARELRRVEGAKVLDIGAGPGFLAEHLLARCDIESYDLLDFSPHMLELARERLAQFDGKVSFHQKSFLEDGWWKKLPAPFDVVVSMQAVHELRDTARIPPLYRDAGFILRSGGVILVADEIAEEIDDDVPFHTAEGHLSALGEAGFEDAHQVLQIGDLAMFIGRWCQQTYEQ